jgi:hypothetical protein
MRRGWGFAASLLVAFGLAICQPVAGAAAACAPGRPQLNCSERSALYYDSLNWGIGGFGALELFEAARPLHLTNPALAQFWRFEAATALTRYEFELAIGSPGSDPAFEQISPPARLPAPKIKPSGIINGHTAVAFSRLLTAEQQEVVNLVAVAIALNRATYAFNANRSDWSNYQTFLAAGFARQAAAAIGHVIPRQRAVSKALLNRGLRLGVGPADQKAAQRDVRKHGFPRQIRQIMVNLGMNSITLKLVKSAFVHAPPDPTTYSMSQYLSSGRVINQEKKAATALRQFASQTPSAPRPS